jgi:hypothetical protein
MRIRVRVKVRVRVRLGGCLGTTAREISPHPLPFWVIGLGFRVQSLGFRV